MIKKLGNSGMIAVETIIAFLGFLSFTAVIITMVNITTVQLRAHHALTQTAMEVSFYGHALQIVGLTGALRAENQFAGVMGNALGVLGAFSDVGDAFQAPNFDDSSGGADFLLDSMDHIENTYNQLKVAWEGGSYHARKAAETVSENPVGFFFGIAHMLLQERALQAISVAFGNNIAPAFFWRYMGIHDGPDGQGYFDAMPVHTDSVNFTSRTGDLFGTSIRNTVTGGLSGGRARPMTMVFVGEHADEIQISVEYYVDLFPFIILPNAFRRETSIPVVQTVAARAWVGDGGRFEAD